MSSSTSNAEASPSLMMRLRQLAGRYRAAFASRPLERRATEIFAIRVASAGLLFLVQVALARWLGASQYGVFAALWTSVLVVGGLAHLGLASAAIRLVPQYLAQGANALLNGFLIGSRAFAVAVSASLAAFVIGVLAIAPGLGGTMWWPIVLAALCLPAFTLTEVQDGISRGCSWTLAGLAPPYILRPALLATAMLVALALAAPATAATAMAGAFAAAVITALVQFILVQQKIHSNVPHAAPVYDLKAWLTAAAPVLVVGACELALQNTDVLVLSALRPSSEVGIYYAAAKSQALALFIHYAVGSAIAGRIASANARGDRAAMEALIVQATRWTFWPTVAFVIVLLGLGIPLLSLFGPAFVAAYPVMLITSIGILARAAAGPADYVLNMLGHQKECARAYVIAALACVAGNLALVPLLGVEGAAIATALAFTIAAVLNRRALTRVTGIDPTAMLLGERSSARPHAAAPAGIELQVIEGADAITALAAEWTALERRAGPTLQAFNTQAWNRRWLTAYITSPGTGPRPVVVAAREQGRLVLVWPLLVQRRFGLRLTTFIGAPVSQYGDVLVEHRQDSSQIIAAALELIASRLKPDALWLRKVRDDAALAPVLAHSDAHRSETLAAPFVALADASGPVRYESLYSTKALKNRRRLLRRLEESGTVVFEDHRGGDRARDLVDMAFAMKRAWLAERGLVSTAIDDDRALAFFRDAAAAPQQDGGAWVSTLLLDGRPIAINVMLEAGNRIYAHIITYDLAYARSGVGVLLMEHCIRTAIAEGRMVFDLLAPADPYKSDWADASVGVHDWCLPLTGRGRLYEIVYLGGARRLAKRLLDKIPCSMRQRLRALRQRLRGRAPSQAPALPTDTA